MKNNWKIIGGFGAHIKSTRDSLIIHHKGSITEMPISDLSHILIIGGHNLHTSTISTLIHHGVCISFCESDGEPVGYIAPYEYNSFEEIQKLQDSALPYSYAYACAQAAIDARLLAIEYYSDNTTDCLLFSGELEILSDYSKELKNLVKIDELRRIVRLVHDMYYEIISRLIHPSYKFSRRSRRPNPDPVNAILSFGYGMLSSACKKSLIGGHLNPSKGFLNQGNNALVNDITSCWMPGMIDKKALEFVRKGGLPSGSYDISKDRCVLTEIVIEDLIELFQETINLDIINKQTELLVQALRNETSFSLIKVH